MTRCPCGRRAAERGSALLPVLLLMFLFAAVSMAIAAGVQVEIRVAGRYASAGPALYAADAALAATVAELRLLPSWTPVLAGDVRSAHADGTFGGIKRVPGGGAVLICCGMQSAVDRLQSETARSPRPARRSMSWQPFLWTAADALMPDLPRAPSYLVAWVADDEEDGDGRPGVDANGVVVVRAEAIEAIGLRRAVEAYVARTTAAGGPDAQGEREPAVPAGVAIRTWREVR